ncbi:MAG: SNF2 family helicase [Verrucomicrobiota bacterium]|nr:SNF2 family helicase [Verrucomicrobiota bacterium]
MSLVELTEKFLMDIAGWEAMKQARAYLAADKILSSNWSLPVLKGVVLAGEISYRAGLVIKTPSDIENLCTCRQSREWGTICAHSVAVGLHFLKPAQSSPDSCPDGESPRQSSKTFFPNENKLGLLRAEKGGSGEAAEIFLIFPLNLEQALMRGKINIFFEGAWSKGRSPLNALPKSELFYFSEQDSALLDRIEFLAGGETPALLVLSPKDFAELLPLLIEHPRLSIGKTKTTSVAKNSWSPPLIATLETDGEIQLVLQTKTALPTLIENEWIFQNGNFQRCGLSKNLFGIFEKPIRLTRGEVPQFLNHDWPRLQSAKNAEANFRLEDFTLEPQSPKFILELKGGLAQLQAHLQCAYGSRIFTAGAILGDETIWLPDLDSPTKYSTRDFTAEQNALNRLTRSGFTKSGENLFQLLGQNQVLNFFAREFPRMQKEWSVTLEERLQQSATKNIERVEPQFQIRSSGMQWFDFNVSFNSSEGEKFSATEIQRLILSGQSHTRLRNGKFAVIDTGAVEELQEVLLDCSPEQNAGGYRVDNAQAGFLDATLRQQGWPVKAPNDWQQRARAQSGEAEMKCPPLCDLENVLRPYQKQGVAWLNFLRGNNFGGILADEMGLGKTLQTLAFLQLSSKQNSEGESPSDAREPRALPSLIICPTSLIFNWVMEVKKFTPQLKILALHGAERHSFFEKIPQHDLIVTSYALIRRDAEKYRDLEFDTVVLDEAQHIKNRQTQNAQAVKAIRAQHRLVLTGTPLENSILDLWSIFDFLMPGYLGAAQDFRERYEIPITREKNLAAQARLARRLRPFILRRLKKEVARDLPEKLEQISFCELSETQRALYQQILEASRKEVLNAVGAQGLQKSRMMVLTALLRLRQICCDARLLKLDSGKKFMDENSGKLEMFSELLEEILDGGHRVLVFSQFVRMLTLLREKLEAEKIEFCYLDGATKNRGQVVERFQTNPQVPVFLISLKAGGVGLNLTGADTVIHFDPWWNPAVEDQATDRAHRLGQTRVVTSYKLIARDTVEEKILLLQTRKREIIKATLAGEEQLAESLTWEEIQELFE